MSKTYLLCELVEATPKTDDKGGLGYVVERNFGPSYWVPNFLFEALAIPVEGWTGDSDTYGIPPSMVSEVISGFDTWDDGEVIYVEATLITGAVLVEEHETTRLLNQSEAIEVCKGRLKDRVEAMLRFVLDWANLRTRDSEGATDE